MSKKPSFSTLIKPAHLKTVRALGYTLTLGNQDAWWALVPILMARLTVEERACLAFMALKSLDDQTGHMTAEAALCAGAGQPQAPLFGYMDQAAFWADMAGLLRWRLVQPRALVQGDDPIAEEFAVMVRETLPDLEARARAFPNLRKYVVILHQILDELQGVGRNPELLLDIAGASGPG